MERAKHYALYLVVGAIAYWVPDILIQWLLRPSPRLWMLFLTFFAPAVVAVTWFLLSRKPSHARFFFGLPMFMLLGVWLFGPLAIAIGALPSGGTFFEPDQLFDFFSLWVMFPIATFTMSTYSGSLGGVCLATLILLVAAGAKAIVSNIAGKGEALAVFGVLLAGAGEIYVSFFMPEKWMPFFFFVAAIITIICFVYLAKLYREGKKLLEEDKANPPKAE
ncbi:MAG: hypothetical protein FWC38_09710 [Proteobacteria bacterium]|nr:hypothetical protein [Pseudomonadota bacterium]MCL2308473.1 hypothetical protein [Pseudomonadota bacterium]